jgi:hypothetical protein
MTALDPARKVRLVIAVSEDVARKGRPTGQATSKGDTFHDWNRLPYINPAFMSACE